MRTRAINAVHPEYHQCQNHWNDGHLVCVCVCGTGCVYTCVCLGGGGVWEDKCTSLTTNMYHTCISIALYTLCKMFLESTGNAPGIQNLTNEST